MVFPSAVSPPSIQFDFSTSFPRSPPFYLPHFRVLPHHFRPFYDCFCSYISIYILRKVNTSVPLRIFLQKKKPKRWYWFIKLRCCAMVDSNICRYYSSELVLSLMLLFLFIFCLYSPSRKTPPRNWVPSKKTPIFIHKIVQGFDFFFISLLFGRVSSTNLLIFFRFHSGLSLNCLNWVVNDAMVYFSFAFIFEMLSKVVEIRFT